MTKPAPTAAICGQNPCFPPERMGCGEPIDTCAEVYRCTECSVPFHKKCAERHFGKSARDRQATINDLTRAIARAGMLIKKNEDGSSYITLPPMKEKS